MPDSTALGSKRQRLDPIDPSAPAVVAGDDAFIQDQDAQDSAGDDDEDEDKPKSDKKAGRRKIKIEFIQDKSRRHITFSKRKAGIMKKAYELSTLTGTQVLLLVVSETGLVYTFTTAKLQPLVTQPEGKNLIQACLNAPHGQLPSSMPVGTPLGRSSGPMSGVPPHSPAQPAPPPNVPGGLAIGGGKDDEANDDSGEGAPPQSAVESPDASDRSRKRRRASSTTTAPNTRSAANSGSQSSGGPPPPPPPPPSSNQASSQAQNANSQPPPPPPPSSGNAATSPHSRQAMPLPNALSIPGGAPQGSQMAPQSPSYPGYPGAGDPNMYAGYAGQPQAAPQGNPYGYPPAVQGGHEQPQPGMAWGPAPGVQQGNHYQRR